MIHTIFSSIDGFKNDRREREREREGGPLLLMVGFDDDGSLPLFDDG